MPEQHPGADLQQAGLGRRGRRRGRGSPAARRPATPAPDPPPGRPPRPAATNGSLQGGPRVAAGSSPRSAPRAASRRGGRTRRPAPPASAPGAAPAGPAGCPPVSASSRSRTGASSGPVSAAASSARASASGRPSTTSSGNPASSSPGTRAANTRATDSATRRRATNPRTWAEALIQPLRVVDQAQQRVLLGGVGQQAQGGQADQEAVRRRPGTQAERGRQRLALGTREPLQAVQHRRQQLVHPGVGELHLRLDTCGMRHPAARRLLDQVVQQRRLAHARLPAHHQGPALTGASSIQELVEHAAFAAPVPQLRRRSPPAGGSPSARYRHYATSTTPQHGPLLGASCATSSRGVSIGGLAASTRK